MFADSDYEELSMSFSYGDDFDDDYDEDFDDDFDDYEEDDEAHAFAYLITSPLNTSLKWQDLKIGDVIRGKNSGCEYMVTMRDTRDSVVSHIGSGGVWLHDSELSSYEKVSLC